MTIGRQPVLRHRVDLHQRVADAGVAGDADNRMSLVRRLHARPELHAGGDANRVGDIRADRAVLIGAVHDLSRPVAAQRAARVACDSVSARGDRRLLARDLAAVEELAELGGDHRRVNGVGVGQRGLVVSRF